MGFRDVKAQLLSIDMGAGRGLSAAEDDYGMVDYVAFSNAATEALRELRANSFLEVVEQGYDGLILSRAPEELQEGLREGLVANDTDKDGKVTRRQMRDALEGLGLAPEHICVCMAGV